MIDVHPDPSKALCDGPQSLTPAIFGSVMDQLRAIAQVMKVELV
jgi:3-deoxy-7-phosphoheptulonate synthase